MTNKCLSEDVYSRLPQEILDEICLISDIEKIILLIENKVRHTLPVQDTIRLFSKAKKEKEEENKSWRNMFIVRDFNFYKETFLVLIDDIINTREVVFIDNGNVWFMKVNNEELRILKKVKKECCKILS